MANLGREAFDRAGDDAQGREEHRVTIARDDLRRDGFGGETEFRRDVRLDARIDIGKGADRARDCAGRDIVARGEQACLVAGEFGMRLRQLESEGDGFGVDAVAAADRRGIFMFLGAAFDRGEQRIDIAEQDVGGARELDCEAGVENVRAGHPLMHEARPVFARMRADLIGYPGEESDNVVPGDRLDRVDRRDVDDRLCCPPVP